MLFPQVLKYIKLHATCPEKDNEIATKYKSFVNVDQYAMGIKEEFIETQMSPHHTAIAHIRMITIASTLYQKLKCILLAAHNVIEFMNGRCDLEIKVPGAGMYLIQAGIVI